MSNVSSPRSLHDNIVSMWSGNRQINSFLLQKKQLTSWVRPNDWTSLPTIGPTDQIFAGLLAITNDETNYISLLANTDAGTYTVNWGDGTSTSGVSNGVAAQHYYTYSNSNITNISSLGYKIVIVTVTPDTGNLTGINLQKLHSQLGTSNNYNTKWLDIAIGSPYLNTLTVSANVINTGLAMLQKFSIISLSSSLTNMAYMFYNCYSLQSVPLFNTINVTNMTSMFQGCYSLQSVPLFNTINVTNMAYMFYNCYSLESVPLFNTINVTNMTSMFYTCYSLLSVPLFNTANVINMASMFYSCYSLQSVPLFNTINVTNMSSMFYNCYSLQSVPLFNTINVTNMSYMLSGCSIQSVPLFNTIKVTNMTYMFQGSYSLQSVPLFNTANVISTASMFYNCYSLQSVPLFNTGNVTNMSSMFYSCYSLQSVPLFNTINITNMTSMFYTCYSLLSVPLFNTANVTNMSAMFQGSYSLQSVPLFNTIKVTSMVSMFQGCFNLSSVAFTLINTSFSVSGCLFSKNSIINLFNILSNNTVGSTITVSNNFGNDTPISKSCGTTLASNVVTLADTSNLVVNMLVLGTGVSTHISTTINSSVFTLPTSMSLSNGKIVSFDTLSGVSGIINYTPYYVVNSSGNTFAVSLTNNGSPITITGSGTCFTNVGSYIKSIVTNTSVTLDAPASANGSGVNLTFSILDVSIATQKGWGVSR